MIVKYSQAARVTTDKPKGGEGLMSGVSYVGPANRPENAKHCMVAENTLPVGGSIGFHSHPKDEEVYIILKGTGTYTDNDKGQHVLTVGDMTLCRQGESHGIANTGAEPLTFAAVVSE
jgi:quercetin dioxygenase-like cupin family protein